MFKTNFPDINFPYYIFVFLLSLNSCKEPQKEMLISTSGMSNILATAADASGTIVDLGNGATQYGHCYGKTSGVTIDGLKTELGAPTVVGSYTSHLTNLEEGTQYYIKAYLSRGKVTVYGTELNFTTGTTPSVISTDPQDGITNVPVNKAISITFSQSMDNSTITSSTFTVRKQTTTVPGSISFSGNTATYTPANNLEPAITYTVLVTAGVKNQTGVPIKNDYLWAFTTQQKPELASAAAGDITNTSATINGAVNANGSSTIVKFDYGLTALYGSSVNAIQNPVTGNSTINVNAVLTGLTPGATYHFRVTATNSGGTSNGSDLSFTTHQLPEARTDPATSVAITTATLNGMVNATNLPTTVSFEYGPNISYGMLAAATPEIVAGVNPVSVSTSLTGLTGGSTYHFRVKAVNTGGTTYGNDLTFTTEPQIQVVLTIRDATTWTAQNTTLTVAPGATIKLYASQSSFINSTPDYTTTSDSNGIVRLYGLTIMHSYFLVVEKGDLSNTKDGYVIGSVFNDQAEVDAAPTQPGGKYVGGLRYLDINADAVINSSDQYWHDFIYLPDQTIVITSVIGK
jgi:hypothetical protein